jgi:prepilin-type N-terminal cleavage/methylation domain-containing protein
MPRACGGFTLPEVMLSAVLLSVVTGAVWQLLFATQRLSRLQSQHLAVQSHARNAATVIANELRELSTNGENDLLSLTPTAITYRAMRGVGFSCQPATGTQLRLARATFSGYRDPQAGRDSAYVFLAADPNVQTDATWLPVSIRQVSSGPCPGAVEPGITLTLESPLLPAGMPAGTAVRIYEVMELRLYRAEGKSWLGARSLSAGESIQPVLGPLAEESGLLLEYLDGYGETTNHPAAVRSVRFSVKTTAATVQPRSIGIEELLTGQVALRNSSRP